MAQALLDKWIAKFGTAYFATKSDRKDFLTECFMGAEYKEAYDRYLLTVDKDSARDFAVALIALVNEDFPNTEERPNGKGYQHLERMVEVLSAKVGYDDREALNKLLGESHSASIAALQPKATSATGTLAPGAQVGDDYTLIKKLGKSGNGDVWLAWQNLGIGNRREVAIKFLHRYESANRFMEEILYCPSYQGHTRLPTMPMPANR